MFVAAQVETDMFQPVFLREYMTEPEGKRSMKKVTVCLVSSLLLLTMLSGCGAVAPQEDKIVLLEQETEAIDYLMGTVLVTDVIATKSLRCSYKQVSDSGAKFAMGNRRVLDVYVKKGETVEEGQLLAELDVSEELVQIEELTYKIARNQTELEYLKKEKASKIEEAKLQYQYYPAWESIQDKSKDQAVRDIETEYQYQIEDYEDTIAADEARLAELTDITNKRQLLAPRSGIVSYIRGGLAGSYVWNSEEPVINIMDTSVCVFETSNVEYARYFNKDTVATMEIAAGNAKGTYDVEPFDMVSWGETIRFSIVGENAEATLGDNGTVHVTVGKKEDVLAVAKEAVHKADDKRYVYIVNDAGLREIKWISTGMVGDSYIEVLDGLEEGEKVVLR